ncbi:LysR family transcriptional regulator [Parasedimentitalea psychrophila]|uniref:LysR family transcriptional regulator n=1 Tax=Parasedimentitalea psychrophila TaxID=2997337 RepID=A0A9Y2L182_9RHOB|nr:LysR family transcriptional regulator [Parasedimentitalea psychrophila]WIY24994.1 LysR family transcriptional regulator [Parasedimentitalea psychrophila]
MTTEPSLPVLRALQSLQTTGSVSQTAVALGVTQSAVSRSISKYEKAIGLQLLRRGVRPLTLTEEGLLVAAHAAEIDRSIRTLSERLETLKQGKEGAVRIGSFGPSASSQILPALLAKFARRYPGISVSILEGSDDRTRKDLVNGNVDIAVLGDRIDEFDAIPIATDQLVALVLEGSPLSLKPAIAPLDLEDAPFVMTLAGSEPVIEKWFEAAAITPNVKHRIQQTHSILALVRAGMGNAIVTSLSLPEDLRGIVVKPLLLMPTRKIYFVKKPVSVSSKAVSVFWDFLSRTILTS